VIEVIDEGVHDFEDAVSEDEYVLTREEDGAELLELAVGVVAEELAIEPEGAETAVEDVAEILVVEVLRFGDIRVYLVDLEHALPPHFDFPSNV
jgi:hypothetical protein